MAGAGIVVGTVLGMITLTRRNDLNKSCPGNVCPQAEADRVDSATGLALGSTISLAVAGTWAVIGLPGFCCQRRTSALRMHAAGT